MKVLHAARRLRALATRRWLGDRARRARHFRRLVRRGEYGEFLFVSGPGGDARRYRCDHQAEQLELLGLRADVGYHDELDLVQLAGHYGCVVLYRVPWDERVERLLAARGGGTRVIADVDDLVFDPERAEEIRALANLPDDELRKFEDSIERLRRTLREVDGVVVSTEPLRAEAAALSGRVTVAHNTVSAEMVESGRRAHAIREARLAGEPGDVVLAYLSGTPTHDRDFLEAADAVVWALDRYPRLRFLAAGLISVDSRFEAFGDRVIRAPYRPASQLPALLATVDVNLAPLERGNRFTDAKSCLKYLEAAVVGVPTVASARSDFRRAIRHDVNGLLADDPESWRAALGRLAESAEERVRLGEEARRDVLDRHTTRACAEATGATFREAAGGGA